MSKPAGLVVLGCLLAFAGAASLALSMVVQRYALSLPPGRVSVCRGALSLPTSVVWFLGLVGYGLANGLYAASLQLGSLSLLASCFTTLLVFNMVFAKCLLGEVLTKPKVLGAATILVGVCLCVAGVADGVQTEFLPKDVEALLERPAGTAYFASLLGGVLASVAGIMAYKWLYPVGTLDAPEPRKPPMWLEMLMILVYPGSLGMNEGVCHLTMKSAISMLANCGDDDSCGRPVVWVFTTLWIVGSLATVWWLRVVFAGYETTTALPIEYGTVNACSVCSGLIFYNEGQQMKSWQLALNLVGLLVILIGIGLGRLPETCSSGATTTTTVVQAVDGCKVKAVEPQTLGGSA